MKSIQYNKPLDKNNLKKIFSNYKQIKAVYLFGSHASGLNNIQSDIDLGIVSAQFTADDKIELLTKMVQHGYCNVDIVSLDNADLITRFEAVHLNQLIYKTYDFDHGFYFSKTLRQYFDFYPYLEVQRNQYKERILNG
jgi:uncharacterized protein